MRKSKEAVVILSLFAAACRHPAPAPVVPAPPAPQPELAHSVVVLLAEADGKVSSISVSNPAGSQTLDQAYQAVNLAPGIAPGAPFLLDPAEVTRRWGRLLGDLPAPEISFLVYFQGGSDVLTPESQAQIPAILKAVQDRRSTAITVIGHTDTTGNSRGNYELGLRRAQAVSAILLNQGASASDLFIESHGDSDLLVPTGRGVDQPRNRRVEIIVR